jgi:hypothetical protein
MIISLKRYLQTGKFGELYRGLSKEAVLNRLGEPDERGGTSRKYPRPFIYLYGTVEVWFQQQRPGTLTNVYWEAGERGSLRLPSRCTIQDWPLEPGMGQVEIEDYFKRNGFVFSYPEALNAVASTLMLSSGVQITLDETEILSSISGLSSV